MSTAAEPLADMSRIEHRQCIIMLKAVTENLTKDNLTETANVFSKVLSDINSVHPDGPQTKRVNYKVKSRSLSNDSIVEFQEQYL